MLIFCVGMEVARWVRLVKKSPALAIGCVRAQLTAESPGLDWLDRDVPVLRRPHSTLNNGSINQSHVHGARLENEEVPHVENFPSLWAIRRRGRRWRCWLWGWCWCWWALSAHNAFTPRIVMRTFWAGDCSPLWALRALPLRAHVNSNL